MSNLIEDLYYGQIYPIEAPLADKNYRKLHRESGKHYEWLSENLETESKTRFEEFVDKNCAADSIETRLRFIDGFRLGAKIILDVMTAPDIER